MYKVLGKSLHVLPSNSFHLYNNKLRKNEWIFFWPKYKVLQILKEKKSESKQVNEHS